MVKITWYGHAMFLVEQPGLRVVTDPYAAEVGYMLPRVEAEVVLISHDHFDHNNAALVGGEPKIVREPAPVKVGPVLFEGLQTDHDEAGGTKRGKNNVYRWQMEGITFCHLGDYGEHSLTEAQQQFLRAVDVLFIPVGGIFTIDAAVALRLIESLKPPLVIPMHFKTPSIAEWKIAPVDDFLQNLAYPVEHCPSTVSVEKETLPKETTVWVLKPAAG